MYSGFYCIIDVFLKTDCKPHVLGHVQAQTGCNAVDVTIINGDMDPCWLNYHVSGRSFI